MTLAELVPLVLKGSIAVLVFTVGLGSQFTDLTYFIRHPWRLVRSLVAMSVVMPIIAVLIDKVCNLHRPVEIALVALALAPVPPLLPVKLGKAGGDHAYTITLLFTASLLSIALIPLGASIMDRIFPADIAMPAGPVAALVFTTILLPMTAGLLVRFVAAGLAERLARPLSLGGTALLAIALVLLLIKIGPVMLSLIGGGTVLALAAFVALGLLVGHLLGPPEPSDRTVLALATASRHPGIAVAIAAMNYPDEKSVPATVLLYLLIAAVVTAPYVAWRHRVVSARPPAGEKAQS